LATGGVIQGLVEVGAQAKPTSNVPFLAWHRIVAVADSARHKQAIEVGALLGLRCLHSEHPAR
jgi:hypothetical protein